MFSRKIEVLAGMLALTQTVCVLRPATLPRPSPELVFTQPSGAETRLSGFKGRVVAIEFLFVRSPHCLRLAQMLNQLNSELGGRGFQPLAVAFGPNADPGVLTSLVDHLKLTYPVGLTTSDKVDAYLGRAGKEFLKIPQMVIVDRNGVIRATSGSQGDPALENELTLRPFLETLLKGNASAPAKPRRSEMQTVPASPKHGTARRPYGRSGTGWARRISPCETHTVFRCDWPITGDKSCCSISGPHGADRARRRCPGSRNSERPTRIEASRCSAWRWTRAAGTR